MALTSDPAWRVFAYEFNKSTIQLKDDEGTGPTYVISPTGAKINRLFVVGVLTEVENVRANEDLWRAQVADPTGSFTVYAGKYQSDAALFFANADVPQFVSVLGRARLYTRGDTSYASIWSNEVGNTTEIVRNNWVVNTAERTLDRLEVLKIAQGSGLQDDALRAKLISNNVNTLLIDGIMSARSSYDGSRVIAELIPIIASAVDTITKPTGFKPASEENQAAHNKVNEGLTADANENTDGYRDEAAKVEGSSTAAPDALERNKERVLLAMNELDSGSGVPYDRLIQTLETQKLEEDEVEEAVQELMDEGKCYEPKLGILKLI